MFLSKFLVLQSFSFKILGFPNVVSQNPWFSKFAFQILWFSKDVLSTSLVFQIRSLKILGFPRPFFKNPIFQICFLKFLGFPKLFFQNPWFSKYFLSKASVFQILGFPSVLLKILGFPNLFSQFRQLLFGVRRWV